MPRKSSKKANKGLYSNFNLQTLKTKGYSRWLVLLGLATLLLFIASRTLVVAWVDKRPVTKFEYFSLMDKRYGKDVKEELIVEKLLSQEAANKKISISNQDVEAEIKRIEEQQGGADKLNQILELQGMNRSDLNNLVKLQLTREKLFGQVTVTDEEVNKYIEENSEQLPAVDDKLKVSIKEQLKQQKVSKNFNDWLTETLKGDRVVRI